MSDHDLDLESNAGDRDNYDLNKFEDFPSQNPNKFDNLIGNSPKKPSTGKNSKNSSGKVGKTSDDAFSAENFEDEQCYDEDE